MEVQSVSESQQTVGFGFVQPATTTTPPTITRLRMTTSSLSDQGWINVVVTVSGRAFTVCEW
jgi:hypothetical protein